MKSKYNNKYLIDTGIGLQDVDGLKNSTYFINESNRYVKGEITLEELDGIIKSYYEMKPLEGDRTEEADKVALRIAKIISDDSFSFTIGQLITIHRRLFDGVLSSAGKLRNYNFMKREWVLDGESVIYGDYYELEATLQYDFDQERRFDYSKVSVNETIEHLAHFISNLWQIHVFEEGNTRTCVVFFIKYLRSMGFDVTNDTFAKNAWYFRNALVRSNYNNIQKSIFVDYTFLIKFLRNLLLNENNELNNREMHISEIKKNNNNELKILNVIKNIPTITNKELALELKVSPRTIDNIIHSLKVNNKIERINGKRYGYWKIK